MSKVSLYLRCSGPWPRIYKGGGGGVGIWTLELGFKSHYSNRTLTLKVLICFQEGRPNSPDPSWLRVWTVRYYVGFNFFSNNVFKLEITSLILVLLFFSFVDYYNFKTVHPTFMKNFFVRYISQI